VEVAGRRVLVREDLNVPLRDGSVADDTRLRAAAPTLRELAERGARVIVMSHLGRPQGRPDPELSLRPLLAPLARLLGHPVAFAEDCLGEAARAAAGRLGDGELLLLENVRFHPEEEAADPGFARSLAELGELYVNDAFAVSHRAHASVVGVAAFLPAYAGDLMEAELRALHQALDQPRRPLVAVTSPACQPPPSRRSRPRTRLPPASVTNDSPARSNSSPMSRSGTTSRAAVLSNWLTPEESCTMTAWSMWSSGAGRPGRARSAAGAR